MITVHRLGIGVIYLNIIQTMYDKPTTNGLQNVGKQSIFPKIRNKAKMPTLSIPIQYST